MKKFPLLLTVLAASSPLLHASIADASAPQVTGAPVPRLWRSQDLLNAIGVNTHLNYNQPQWAYANFPAVQSALQYLGVTNIREGLPVAQPTDPRLSPYYALLNQGLSMTFSLPADVTITGGYASFLAGVSATLANFVTRYPSQIKAIEGQNEPDLQNDGYIFTYAGLTGAAAVAKSQIDLYNTVKGNPITAAVPVWSFSLNSPPYNQQMYEQVYAANPAVMKAFDFGNRGVVGGFYSPEWRIRQAIYNPLDIGYINSTEQVGPYNAQLKNLPISVKEAGLPSAPGGLPALGLPDYPSQAKMLPGTIFDAIVLGASHEDIYELVDEAQDPTNSQTIYHWGLFDFNWNPKPAGMVMRNILTRLQDSASNATTFTPRAMNVSVRTFPLSSPGVQPSGATLTTQKANGTFNIFVWYEPLIWNQQTDSPAPVAAPLAQTMYLSATCNTTSVYDPYTDTTVAGPSNASAIPFSLPDHPIMVTCNSPH